MVKRLKKESVPHVFPWSRKESESAAARKERALKRETLNDERAASIQNVAAYEEIESEGEHVCMKYKLVRIRIIYKMTFVANKFQFSELFCFPQDLIYWKTMLRWMQHLVWYW